MRTIVRLLILFGLLGAVSHAAVDLWIGTWEIVWASASYDDPIRLTVGKQPDGLHVTWMAKPMGMMRRVDQSTAEYTIEREGRPVTVRCTVRSNGKELALRFGTGTGADGEVFYDRVNTGPVDAANPMVGVWLFNEPKTVLQRKSPTVYEVDPTGRLRFHISGQGYAAAFDGNDHPLSGDPTARTVALKRIDSRTFQETLKDASGKEVQVRRVAVSEDGNELKLTNTGVFMGGRGHRALIFRRKN